LWNNGSIEIMVGSLRASEIMENMVKKEEKYQT
jgi:hypothetical protein